VLLCLLDGLEGAQSDDLRQDHKDVALADTLILEEADTWVAAGFRSLASLVALAN
jgi:hypothetical protein